MVPSWPMVRLGLARQAPEMLPYSLGGLRIRSGSRAAIRKRLKPRVAVCRCGSASLPESSWRIHAFMESLLHAGEGCDTFTLLRSSFLLVVQLGVVVPIKARLQHTITRKPLPSNPFCQTHSLLHQSAKGEEARGGILDAEPNMLPQMRSIAWHSSQGTKT